MMDTEACWFGIKIPVNQFFSSFSPSFPSKKKIKNRRFRSSAQTCCCRANVLYRQRCWPTRCLWVRHLFRTHLTGVTCRVTIAGRTCDATQSDAATWLREAGYARKVRFLTRGAQVPAEPTPTRQPRLAAAPQRSLDLLPAAPPVGALLCVLLCLPPLRPPLSTIRLFAVRAPGSFLKSSRRWWRHQRSIPILVLTLCGTSLFLLSRRLHQGCHR